MPAIRRPRSYTRKSNKARPSDTTMSRFTDHDFLFMTTMITTIYDVFRKATFDPDHQCDIIAATFNNINPESMADALAYWTRINGRLPIASSLNDVESYLGKWRQRRNTSPRHHLAAIDGLGDPLNIIDSYLCGDREHWHQVFQECLIDINCEFLRVIYCFDKLKPYQMNDGDGRRSLRSVHTEGGPEKFHAFVRRFLLLDNDDEADTHDYDLIIRFRRDYFKQFLPKESR